MTLNQKQRDLCDSNDRDFSDLAAVFVNCTLKKSPERSHTQGLMDVSRAIMETQNVHVDVIRAVDHEIPPGVYPNMTEHGWPRDDWPGLFKRIIAADILVLGTPIWLGEASSIASRVIERLYGQSGELNEHGQYIYYGRVGGCMVTGNEDGVKHCARSVLYALQHLGYVIPPQADAGWIGEVGPGPSYLDEGSGGPENDFTQRNTTFMTWNLLHLARMIRDAGGDPRPRQSAIGMGSGLSIRPSQSVVPLDQSRRGTGFQPVLIKQAGCLLPLRRGESSAGPCTVVMPRGMVMALTVAPVRRDGHVRRQAAPDSQCHAARCAGSRGKGRGTAGHQASGGWAKRVTVQDRRGQLRAARDGRHVTCVYVCRLGADHRQQ